MSINFPHVNVELPTVQCSFEAGKVSSTKHVRFTVSPGAIRIIPSLIDGKIFTALGGTKIVKFSSIECVCADNKSM